MILNLLCSRALAQQLQEEEDHLARRRQEAYLRERAQKEAQKEEAIAAQREREIREREERIKTRKLKLKKPDCVIM